MNARELQLHDFRMEKLRKAMILCESSTLMRSFLYQVLLSGKGAPLYVHSRRWPRDLQFEKDFNGIYFTLYRSGDTPAGLMRFYIDCPVCQKHLSVGRLCQHSRIHGKITHERATPCLLGTLRQ